MKKPLKITLGNLTKFSNALHTQFHNEMYDIVLSNIAPEIINLTLDTFEEWEQLIKLEIDINRQATMSDITKLLSEVDNKRDDIIIYIFNTIRAALKSPIESQLNAARKLEAIVKTYSGIHSKGLDEETILITGLCTDLLKSGTVVHVQALGLLGAVDVLESTNEEFRRLRSERSEEQVRSALPTAKDTRPKTDEIYETICQYIIASHLLSNSATDCAEIEALVERMNKLIGDLKTVNKQSGAKKPSTSRTTN